MSIFSDPLRHSRLACKTHSGAQPGIRRTTNHGSVAVRLAAASTAPRPHERTHARAQAHTQHRYMRSKLIVQAARAGLIVSPAASKIGNFNGVSTAVVVPPAPQSNLLSGRGGGALPLVSHNVRGYFIKDGGTDPPRLLCQRRTECRIL